LKIFYAALATLAVVLVGVAYPVPTTIGLALLAGIGVTLHGRRAPPPLPPTRHARRVRFDNLLD
jgi:multidrug transporter EmrE-like cation transporter